jgi:hypothetical protein
LFSTAVAQEPKEGEGEEAKPENDRPGNATEGYEAYLELLDVKYVPPEKPGTAQMLDLKFNLVLDIPKGAKIRLALERFGLEQEETEYTLKEDKRTDLTFQWKLKNKLASGEEYQLRTHLHLDKQTPAVQKLIRQNQKKFPPKSEPWSWYLKPAIKIGSPEEEAEQGKVLCDTYTALMEKLVESFSEFDAKMTAVKEGKELVKGGALDKEAFEKYVLEWRKKQGAVQKEIREFQANEPGLVQKSPSAYAKVVDLGRMVSKRCAQVQKEASDQYKVAFFNPAVEDFDRAFRYAVTFELLQERYKNVRTILNCPEDEEGAAAEEKADEKPAAEGDAEATPGEEKPAEEGSGEEPKPEETPKEEPKKAGKKAPDKKAPPKGAKSK